MPGKKNLPTVSFVIPTLNAERYLEDCLQSILDQNFEGEIEILIIDGGSADRTRDIALSYGARLLENPLKTAESGKAVGIKNAVYDYVCFVDSDNLIVDPNWLKKMVAPLENDTSLIGSEPLYFTHREEDGFIDRYCALMGMNDPLVFWLGSYDRMNILSGTWTGLDIKQEDRGEYLEVYLESGNTPTIGANGTVFRKAIFSDNEGLFGDYFFDMDMLEALTRRKGVQKFSKVKVGIVHLFCGNDLGRFYKKQLRRVRDYLFRRSLVSVLRHKNTEKRKYTYGKKNSIDLIKSLLLFVISTFTLLPLIFQSFKGYSRKKDIAWFAHPLLCWITLVTYSLGSFSSLFKRSELSREGWR